MEPELRQLSAYLRLTGPHKQSPKPDRGSLNRCCFPKLIVAVIEGGPKDLRYPIEQAYIGERPVQPINDFLAFLNSIRVTTLSFSSFSFTPSNPAAIMGTPRHSGTPNLLLSTGVKPCYDCCRPTEGGIPMLSLPSSPVTRRSSLVRSRMFRLTYSRRFAARTR
jgi:hypothetical protein